jgi:hypothetical protein
MELPQFVHEAVIRETQQERLIGHIARDSTAIEARERFPETAAQRAARKAAEAEQRRAQLGHDKPGPKPGKRGGSKRYKGGKRPHPPHSDSRLARQRTMGLPQMMAELPRCCDVGAKADSHGNDRYWRGYKLHLDVADGQVPISAVLTSASVHDSQVAIPLATLSTQRVTYCYDLMDSAYDAQHIDEHLRALGHVPIIDPHGRRRSFSRLPALVKPQRQLSWAEEQRYRERTMVERVYARLKDEFGGREIRVRGAQKVMAHLMFGVLALTADQILKLAM